MLLGEMSAHWQEPKQAENLFWSGETGNALLSEMMAYGFRETQSSPLVLLPTSAGRGVGNLCPIPVDMLWCVAADKFHSSRHAMVCGCRQVGHFSHSSGGTGKALT
jgi:hypothetical protein